eukprot:912677-Heterocapsa_arctica.AAC.1
MAENLAILQSRLDRELVATTRHPASSIPIPVTASIGEAIDVSTPPPAFAVGGASVSRGGAPPNPPTNGGGNIPNDSGGAENPGNGAPGPG